MPKALNPTMNVRRGRRINQWKSNKIWWHSWRNNKFATSKKRGTWIGIPSEGGTRANASHYDSASYRLVFCLLAQFAFETQYGLVTRGMWKVTTTGKLRSKRLPSRNWKNINRHPICIKLGPIKLNSAINSSIWVRAGKCSREEWIWRRI